MRIDPLSRKSWLPANVTPFTDKCGRVRYRFRKTGLPYHLFRADPGTPEFAAEYQAAKSGKTDAPAKWAPGSFHALIESYYRSKRYKKLGDEYRRMRTNSIERFRLKHGDKPVTALQARHIVDWMDELASPHAANDLRKMLAQLMKHAILTGLRDTNPVDVIDPVEIESDGYHCWTEDEIAAFDTRWPLGTRERLAKELLLYTALRRKDMVVVGKQNLSRDGRKLILRHTKNKSETVIRVLPPLAAALGAIEHSHLTYLVTDFGKPFTPAGFGNWFRDRCNLAGLPQCSAHGLRKAMSRRLAEAGATNAEGRAVTGHKTDAMFNHYARSASVESMADRAADLLSDSLGFGKNSDQFAKGDAENG